MRHVRRVTNLGTTNLLGLAAGACSVAAVGGLAGALWALLLLGVLLAAMTWVSHLGDDTQAQIDIQMEKAMAVHLLAAAADKESALAHAADVAAFNLDQAVATERAKADATVRMEGQMNNAKSRGRYNLNQWVEATGESVTVEPMRVTGLKTEGGRPVIDVIAELLVHGERPITVDASLLEGLRLDDGRRFLDALELHQLGAP